MLPPARAFFPVPFSPEEGKELLRSSDPPSHTGSSSTDHPMKIHTSPETVPPRSSDKSFTVVWDIDRTLINIDQISKGIGNSFIYRPYALQSLRALSDHYPQIEFIVWTAGDVNHARYVITDILQRHPKIRFDHVIARTPGEPTDHRQHSRKPLQLLKRDVRSMIIVDDSPSVCQHNPSNCIAVYPYEGSESLKGPDCDLFYVAQVIGMCAALSSKMKISFSEAMSGLPFVARAMSKNVEYSCINWSIRDKASLQSAIKKSFSRLPHVHGLSHERQ